MPTTSIDSASFLFSFLDGSADGQVGVDDESLREKSNFFEELAHATINHLLDDRVGLPERRACSMKIARSRSAAA